MTSGGGSLDAAVRFADLGGVAGEYHDDLLAACEDVLRSGRYVGGPQLARLESELSARLDGRPVVGVGSGTQALQVLLLAHGIGPGDEVVTTAASFYATAKAVSMTGARPVFADVSPADFNLDPAAAEAAVTPRTRAILAVHLYGRPAPMAALGDLARRAGVPLLEDAAQAFGASVGGVPAGALGDGAAFSCYPTKNLGAFGDAGFVVLPDAARAARARAARFLGWDGVERDRFPEDGISGRMDELQAALLRVRLAGFDREQERRRALVARYRSALPAGLLPAPAPPGVVDAHHLFVVRHPRRDLVAARLGRAGIETGVHYRHPLHRQRAYASGLSLPETESWAARVLSLPLHAALTDDEVDRVALGVVTAIRPAVA